MPHAYTRGFTYVEVVIAVGLVAICLVASEALIHAVPLEHVTHDEDVALTIANDELGALRQGGYNALPASDSFSNPLLTTIPSGAGTVAVSSFNAETAAVTVTVSWQEPSTATTRSVVLSTLITQTGGLP